MTRTVTEINERGEKKGEIDLIRAHTIPCTLHRAFSVFIFTPDHQQLLLQKRNSEKPTFGGLWANTCCSHQYAGEEDVEAGKRRLKEEMGFTTDVEKGSSFIYQAEDPRKNGMGEYEHDTVILGTAPNDIALKPDPKEVSEWKWVMVSDLIKDLKENPTVYVPWLKEGLMIAMQFLKR